MTTPMHFALPLALAPDGQFAMIAQDSPQEVLQSVRVILLTDLGERLAVPEFGTPDGAFAPVDAAAVAASIDRWDDRAAPEVTVQVAGLDGVTLGRVAVAAAVGDAA